MKIPFPEKTSSNGIGELKIDTTSKREREMEIVHPEDSFFPSLDFFLSFLFLSWFSFLILLFGLVPFCFFSLSFLYFFSFIRLIFTLTFLFCHLFYHFSFFSFSSSFFIRSFYVNYFSFCSFSTILILFHSHSLLFSFFFTSSLLPYRTFLYVFIFSPFFFSYN